MSVGYSVGKGDLDLTLGVIATGTRDLLTKSVQVTNWLATQTDTQLANLGYSTAEVAFIRTVQTDMTNLAAIIQGTGTLTTAYNFTTNLKQMYGMH